MLSSSAVDVPTPTGKWQQMHAGEEDVGLQSISVPWNEHTFFIHVKITEAEIVF